RTFETLGCAVEEVRAGFADSHEMIRMMWNAHEAGNYARYLGEWRDRMDPGLVGSIENGLAYSLVDYVEMRGRKIAYWDTVRPLFERYDLLLTPSLSIAALPVGRLNPESWPQPSNRWDWIAWASFSYPFNFTGQQRRRRQLQHHVRGKPVGQAPHPLVTQIPLLATLERVTRRRDAARRQPGRRRRRPLRVHRGVRPADVGDHVEGQGRGQRV